MPCIQKITTYYCFPTGANLAKHNIPHLGHLYKKAPALIVIYLSSEDRKTHRRPYMENINWRFIHVGHELTNVFFLNVLLLLLKTQRRKIVLKIFISRNGQNEKSWAVLPCAIPSLTSVCFCFWNAKKVKHNCEIYSLSQS